jgi:hypothetical protein
MINEYKTVVRKSKWKTSSEISRRWEDNIKTDLKEIQCEDVDWIHLKMAVFWVVGHVVWYKFTNVSEVLADPIITASPLKRW